MKYLLPIAFLLTTAIVSGCGQESSPPSGSPLTHSTQRAADRAAKEPAPEEPSSAERATKQPAANTASSTVAPQSTDNTTQSDPNGTVASVAKASTLSYQPVAQSIGISHTFITGATGQLLMVESVGGGLGWTDLDQDDLPDLFCVQGGDATNADLSANPSDQLFRQLPGGQFVAVTPLAGIDDREFGQGVVAGDFDNDGWPDLYISNVGHNQLYHNLGDGTYERISSTACTAADDWSSSAAWADVDLDGDLDLYVCNYLKYDPRNPLLCEKDGVPALCHPRQLPAIPDEFFENLGDGSFRSMAKQKGLLGPGNKGLGVVITDLTGDGRPDIYVANDTTRNFYFVNQPDGSFEESSLTFGGGSNDAGAMQASMGIAAGDFDRSGTTDILLSHFTNESNTLYENLGSIGLYDVSGKTGLFPISRPKLGFGIVMEDFDANGEQDVFVANGHIDSTNADGDGFVQNAQLLTFDGRRWQDVSNQASEYFSHKHVGRGVATGDYDNDGDLDLAIVNHNEPLEILENTSTLGRWLKLVPKSRESNRSAIGTTAVVEVGGQKWFSGIHGGTSFCSSHQHVMFFGCGNSTGLANVTVTWPSGKVSILEKVSLNQTLVVREPR